MTKVEIVASITIKASSAEVFHYLKHLKYHQLWNPHLISISPITDLKLGTEYKTSSMLLGVKVSGTNVATKFEIDKELELNNNAGLIKYCVNYKLRQKGENTTLRCLTTVSSTSKAFAFAKSVLETLARRELQSDLSALKIAVEQKLSALS